MTASDTNVAEATEQAAARRILDLFLPAAAALAVQRLPGGLSGAAVFVCQSTDQKFALKRWPPGTKAARVDEVHQWLTESRRTCSLIPALVRSTLGATRLSWESYHYELATWVPGEPVDDQSDGDRLAEMIAAGAEAIAKFHDSARHLGVSNSPPPAVLRRLGRIDALRRELPAALADQPSPTPTLRWAADWLRRVGSGTLDAAAFRLGRWAGQLLPTQVVLRDVHRDHVLFLDHRVSGIVDFDALGIDSIAADLGRWVAGLLSRELTEPAESADRLWAAAERGYRRYGRISSGEIELARDIAAASEVIQLANWVVWTHSDWPRFHHCKDLVDRRVSEIMRRMESDPNRLSAG